MQCMCAACERVSEQSCDREFILEMENYCRLSKCTLSAQRCVYTSTSMHAYGGMNWMEKWLHSKRLAFLFNAGECAILLLENVWLMARCMSSKSIYNVLASHFVFVSFSYSKIFIFQHSNIVYFRPIIICNVCLCVFVCRPSQNAIHKGNKSRK